MKLSVVVVVFVVVVWPPRSFTLDFDGWGVGGGGGGVGGVAVPFYPVQDCCPISEEHRLRKSSPFFEITCRGWTPCPRFQVDFSFDSL